MLAAGTLIQVTPGALRDLAPIDSGLLLR